ncbi:hypothetical protein GLAREA_08073 [Glarea lozoyensis ATCC 20868]|uniref:DUF2306 domain-containing protein n=1 Tax=Glarea lozoyensis (strain ATCC 20868 / MF5171) TaxID=1116229 RepID=S3DC34_GLAL2|nr:uncharacterized protein GLAREA_08073 [Glarea lozoyensis ATCC 20868]EPE24223.1 hypothetical protein GLAREA_08073 [Glarea lozoyensis ATCC 20868]
MVSAPLRLTGFTKTSALVYFFLSAGLFAIFCLAELRWLHWQKDAYTGATGRDPVYAGKGLVWNSPRGPGEGFLYKRAFLRALQQVHLWSVIPAGILLPLQFLPIVRRKYITLHRWAGRLLFILLMIGNITAYNLGMNAFGGMLDTRMFTLILLVCTTLSAYKAWKGIRDHRIDIHRAWTIRCWSYVGSILSLRVWMVILIVGIMRIAPDTFYVAISCAKMEFMFPDPVDRAAMYERHPSCFNLTTAASEKTYMGISANMKRVNLEETTAILSLVFGLAGMIGLIMNIGFVETYLNLTRDDDERLKKFSMAKRRKLGLEKPEGKEE